MNSIFGIGLPELFFIAIIALIVLGPERLPGAIREVAKFLKQVRALGNELTSQFSEELAFLDEMNPRRIIEEATRPEQDKKEKPAAKTSTKPKTTAAKTSTSNAAKPKATTPKPAASTTAKTTTAKSATAKAESTKTAADKSNEAVAEKAQSDEAQPDEAQSDEAQSDKVQSTTAPDGAAEAAKVEAPPKSAQMGGSTTAPNANFESSNGKAEAETENSIAPPELMHAIEQDAIEQDAGKNGDSPAVKAASTATDSSSIGNGVDSAKTNEAPPAVKADTATAETQV